MTAQAALAAVSIATLLPSPPPAGQHAAPLPACWRGTVLTFVAHTDDDLLFMNPDQYNAIRQGQCMRVVYLTAGDRGEGQPYLQARERGIMAAYARMARVANRWRNDGWSVGGHTIVRHTLLAAPRVQLLMLRIPDPWLGPGWGSLTPLSRLESVSRTNVQSYAPYRETYTRSSLVAWLSSVIQAVQPSTIRLMDASIATAYTQLCWHCPGHDHPDHIAGAKLVREAMRQTPGPYLAQAYLGYPSQERPANLTAIERAFKTATFLRYMVDDPHYCPPQTPCSRPKGPETAWVWRQYRIGPDGQPLTPVQQARQ
ncbi:PIG-L family deacetylase [Castellaniella sp.]|uniref:PIG-L family deacetylase n=1 Tax=Castellaniella sp. TaxID=1955812 RepID=UPI002AFE5C38|nr:PIG-L family deacetylase [Castellaniella sp.]